MSPFSQVVSNLIEQLCGFKRDKSILIYKFCTDLRMWQVTLTLRPCFDIMNFLREGMMNSTDSPLCPHALHPRIHVILDNSLHKAMNREHLLLTVPLNERIGTQ